MLFLHLRMNLRMNQRINHRARARHTHPTTYECTLVVQKGVTGVGTARLIDPFPHRDMSVVPYNSSSFLFARVNPESTANK